MIDKTWVRQIVDKVMVPVVRLFLQIEPRLNQKIINKFPTIEDFGAVGDNVADDTNAFDAYVVYLRAQEAAGTKRRVFALGTARNYRVTRSVNFTNLSDTVFNFNGSTVTIRGVTLAVPLIDMTGSTRCRLINGEVTATDIGNPVLTGVFVGRVNGAVASEITFENMRISGYFSRAAVQNSGCDFFTGDNVHLINTSTSTSAVGIIHDATGVYTAPSAYVSSNTVSNTPSVTCNNIRFVNSSIMTAGGSAVWKNASSNHVEQNCIYTVPTAGSVYTLMFQTDTDTSTGRAATIAALQLKNITVNPHTFMFLLTGNAPVYYLNYLTVELLRVTSTGSLFKIDPAYSSATVLLTDSTLHIPTFVTLSATVFGVPTRYSMSGAIEIRGTSSVVWNTPAIFTGQLRTDNYFNFTFNALSRVDCIDAAGWWIWKNNQWSDVLSKFETRIRLTQTTSYYVEVSGSDTTGDGTMAHPWATGSYAAAYIAQYIDFANQNVIVHMGVGNFASVFIPGRIPGLARAGQYQFKGAGSTTIVNGTGFAAAFLAYACPVTITDVTVLNPDVYPNGTGIFSYQGSIVNIDNITFGACGYFQILALDGSYLSTFGPSPHLYVTGNSLGFFNAAASGTTSFLLTTVTFQNAITYSTAVAVVSGVANAYTMTFVNPGNVTGLRYYMYLPGIIDTHGGGATYFPGTSAGYQPATGSNYI